MEIKRPEAKIVEFLLFITGGLFKSTNMQETKELAITNYQLPIHF